MNPALIQQIESALAGQNFSEALKSANRLISEFPGDAAGYVLLGDVFAGMENWAKALENYQKAIDISADDAHIYFKIGEMYELRDDYRSARENIQIAMRLEPDNKHYSGRLGVLVYEEGLEKKNVNLQQEGYQLMEQSLHGNSDMMVRDALANACINVAYLSWKPDPEKPDEHIATERSHLEQGHFYLNRAKGLIDGRNIALNNRISELENNLQILEKRKFAGYKYLLNPPIVVGLLMLLFGSKILGIILLLMGAAYYVSQLKPGYLFNRIYFKNDYRDPFIVRRLDDMSRNLSDITIFSSSLSELLWMRFMFRFFFGAIRYAMVLVLLPYEIVKGFLINYELIKYIKDKAAQSNSKNLARNTSMLFYAVFCTTALTAQTVIFEETFENGTLDPAFWSIQPSAQGLIAVAQESPYDGAFALKIGKNSDNGGLQTQVVDLKLNLLAYNNRQVALTFWILDYFDETQSGDGIYFSNNGGGSFTKVLDFKPSDWCDNQYGTFPPIDVDELARKAFGNNWATPSFVIRFQQQGVSDFSGSADGFYIDDVQVTAVEEAYFRVTPSTPYFNDFEICRFDRYESWRFADQTNTLAAIPTRPSNFVGVVPDEGLGSSCGVAFGKHCDDGPATNAVDFRFDFSGQSQIALAFWMRNYFDETQNDDGIYFSNDGGITFKKALDFKPSAYCDNQWGYFPPLDIDELAAKINMTLTDKFIIRFQQYGSSDFSGTADGFYIDDVKVYVEEHPFFPVSAGQPFTEDFETGSFRTMWDWNWADKTNTLADIATRPSNYVWVENGEGFNGSEFAAAFGKRCEDGFATNALDLYLNLANLRQVKMTFWIRDYFDETQKDDGIYFSNDGGLTFKKAFSFNPTDWCDNVWGQFPPFDIAAMAQNIGMTLTDRFVIRIQQHGSSDFSGTADGWYIDDVRVYVPVITYAPVPFFDNFETGKEGSHWSQGFGEAIVPDALPMLTRPSNSVQVESGWGNNSEYGALFAKRCDDGFAANVFDLHVNLFGASGVKLTFDLLDYFDNPHEQDAIFFSNDGGKTFVRIFGFNFQDVPDNIWQTNWPVPSINLDALVAQAGLAFTDKCIIRFQQYGENDLSGTADGMIIDNVRLTANQGTTAVTSLEGNTSITVYPNPANDEIQIEIHNFNPGEINWRIYTNYGVLLDSGKSTPTDHNFSVSLTNVTSGLLWLAIQDGNKVWQAKVLKI